MVFITPVYRKITEGRQRATQLIAALIIILGLSAPAWASDEGRFQMMQMAVNMVGDRYTLDASIDFYPNDAIINALHNGVTLNLDIDIEMFEQRNWWWDKDLAELTLHYQLRYFALSRQYILHDIQRHTRRSFQSLDSALKALGTLKGIQLLDSETLLADADHEIRVRIQTNIDNLPPQLKPMSFFSSSWHQSSDWHIWIMQQ